MGPQEFSGKPVASDSGAQPSAHSVAQWVDLMDATEQLLLAGLRREIGPTGDIRSAYRRWYAEQMEEHDRMIRTMLEELHRREGRHAR